jgi:hypothetical protein
MANKPAPSALAQGEQGSYATAEAAAVAGLRSIANQNTEVGGGVLYNNQNQKYAYTQPVGQQNGAHFGAAIQVPSGWKMQALYHTHPVGAQSTLFSDDDTNMANQLKVPSYILPRQDDTIRRFDPGSKINSDSSAYGAKVDESQLPAPAPPPAANATATDASAAAPSTVPVSGSSPAASQNWSPPAADLDWTPPTSDRDTTDFSDDDSPEAAEAMALAGGTQALAHQVVGGTLGVAGKLAGRVADVLPGGADWTGAPRKADIWGEAGGNVMAPTTTQGQGVEQAAGQGMAAIGRAASNLPGVNTPAGQSIIQGAGEVAQDVGLAGAGLGFARGIAGAGAETSTISRFGEPPAPLTTRPGPPVRADFEPRPATTASAPAAAVPPSPEAPARVPVPGKPHITPRAQAQVAPTAAAAAEHIRAQEGEMGQAGAESAPESAAAPPTPPTSTPSAAPDAAGNPAPDVHDPGFFPPPDNQDLKSVPAGPQEQLARQAAVERGAPTLPQVRDSAITNDYAAQGRDWTGKQAGDPAAVAQIAAESQALHSEASRISSDTGGQLGTGESADTVRGSAYQDWHDSTLATLKGHIDQAYATEDAQAKTIASPGSNLKGALADDSLIDSANAGSARNSTLALAKNMGVDLTDPNSTMNAYQVEQLRKHVSSIYGNAPRFAQAVKNAADADLPQGAYLRARALNKLKSQMFDNNDGINQLGPSKDINPDTGKPRPENRAVKAPQVMSKIESMDPGQVQHIVSTMKNSSTVLDRLGDHVAAQSITDKAFKAAQQLQSHFTERWADEAGKGGGWNQRRADQFLRGNQETMASVFSPEQMNQIRNVNNAANVLDLDKRYKGAFAQFRTGASWLRQRAGRLAEGMITDAIPFGNTIGEATGLSEGLRNKLGGASTANAPKNFTRPLGEKLPGQRGAVGLLNKPGIVHDYDPATGAHTVTSPNGETVGRDAANGRDIISQRDDTHPEAQGGGEATRRAMKLADFASERSGSLHSDTSVSPAEAKVFSAVGRSGYDIKKNPNARISDTTGNWVSNDPREPVFTATKHSPSTSPQAGAIPGETTPLGRSIFGGRQAGAVGDLTRKPEGGNPYNSAPVKPDVWGNERNVQDRTGTGAAPKSSGNPYDWGGAEGQKNIRTPLGARLGGGRQRGAIGNNLNPKTEPAISGTAADNSPPKKLTGPEISTPGYIYHATSAENLKNIRRIGKLNTHTPNEFTDQNSWPDGSTEKRNYFTSTAKNTWQFAPEEGTPALLRMRADAHPIKTESTTGDLYSKTAVGAKNMEYLSSDNSWKPIIGGRQRGAIGNLNPKESGATVNIGLHQGDPANGGRVMKPGEATAALRSQGVKVGKTSIQTGGAEPTMVADIHRPLTEPKMQNVLAKTKQSAIPQRTAAGNGSISVAPGHEATAAREGWDKYNPESFQMHDGRSAAEHDAERHPKGKK